MAEPVQSYSEFVAQQTRPPGAPARYYEILFQTLYVVIASEAAIPAFKASLTPLEQLDIAWWQDQILAQFEQYQAFRTRMMEEAKPEGQAAEESPQQVMRRMAEELKRLWRAVSSDLEAAYILAGRPHGEGTAALQAWAAAEAPVRRAARDEAWQHFVESLGLPRVAPPPSPAEALLDAAMAASAEAADEFPSDLAAEMGASCDE